MSKNIQSPPFVYSDTNGHLVKTLFYTFLFLLIGIIACKSKNLKAAEEIIDKIPEPKNLNVGNQNYILDIPEGWTTRHRTFQGIEFYYLNAPKTEADPNTNINVLTEFMQNLSLEEYKAKTIESVKKGIPSASAFAEGDIEANGLKGGWYSYTMAPQGIKASLVCYLFPKDGIAYIITAGTQAKDAHRYRNTFDSVARSLRFDE